MNAAGLIVLSLGHKGELPVALTWRGAGDVSEELPDTRVPQRAPEGTGGKHVENGVDGAADEDHSSADIGHVAAYIL